MKVDTKILTYIENVVETASLVKIDNIIIETDKVRAVNDEKTAVLFQNKGVPALPFNSIGLNRIEIFRSRYDIAKTTEQFEVEAVMCAPTPERPEIFVRALIMKGKGFKIDYRCADPATIQSPRVLTDVSKYEVKMTPEAVLLMSKGVNAMGAEDVTFIGTKNSVSFEMEDVNKDIMSYKFANGITVQDDDKDPHFKYTYAAYYVLALFKQNSDGHFHLTTKGMMKIVVNGLDIYILPRV